MVRIRKFGRRWRLLTAAVFMLGLGWAVGFGRSGADRDTGEEVRADGGMPQKSGGLQQAFGEKKQTEGEHSGMSPSGELALAGSSSMEKLTDALAECFMERNPDVAITVQFTGSSAGIEAVAQGRADIGIVSRTLSEEEKGRGLTGHIVALDGIAVCVDPENPVAEMTRDQLKDIYTGEITNWSSFGGGNVPIVVIGREAGSGTREVFEELLGVDGQCTYANELDSTGAVMARIASTPGAIGYLSFDALPLPGGTGDFGEWKDKSSSKKEGDGGNSVCQIALDGIPPTAENVKNGTYPLCRPFLMVTKGELSAQDSLVRLWLQFVYSEEGQGIAEKVGLVGKVPGERE